MAAEQAVWRPLTRFFTLHTRIPPPSTTEITQLLARFPAGDTEAAEKLMPIIYDEPRRCLKKNSDNHTLHPTELVHETYMRLFKPGKE